MLKDYFKFALGSIAHRKLRSWLTMIGIFIGIAAVVSLVSLGQGFEEAIKKEFRKIGTDKLFITAKSGFGPPGLNAVNPLARDDLSLIRKVSGVESAAAFIIENSRVEFDDSIGFFPISGIPKGEGRRLISETQSLEIKDGRNLRDNDKLSAVVGINFAEKELLGKNIRLRDKIKINGREFIVVGILKKTGDPERDKGIFLPEDTVREIFSQPEKVDTILVKVADVSNINSVTEKIKSELRRERNVKKDEEDFDIQTPEQILSSFNDILNIVQSVLIGIALISLIVGGVGIANTMYTAVVERTKEIGIMKSIGAQNKDIMLIFIIESGMLGAAGGLIGVLLGFVLSKGVELAAKNILGTALIEAYFSYGLFFGALAFSFAVGVIFGIMPARQASLMKPVDALRFK